MTSSPQLDAGATGWVGLSCHYHARRTIHDGFAELLDIPATENDPTMRLPVVAASEQLLVREITDNGTDAIPSLAPTLVELATRMLTPA
jgi:hypothetical protein